MKIAMMRDITWRILYTHYDVPYCRCMLKYGSLHDEIFIWRLITGHAILVEKLNKELL